LRAGAVEIENDMVDRQLGGHGAPLGNGAAG
jgi:hypothetical protein